MQDLLVCIVGISGSGKSVIVKELCKYFNKKEVISYTTRPPRDNNDDTHIFIREEDVEKYKNEIAAWTFIDPFQYFATNKQLDDPDAMFYVIDPDGVKWLKENYIGKKLLILYVNVNQIIAQNRTTERGDKIDAATQRQIAEKERFIRFEQEHEYDAVINNTLNLRYAVEDAITIIKYARMEAE